MLDLDQGNVTVWKNDEKLGVMQAEGLSGPFCWALEQYKAGTSGLIESAPAPASPTAEELTAAKEAEQETARRDRRENLLATDGDGRRVRGGGGRSDWSDLMPMSPPAGITVFVHKRLFTVSRLPAGWAGSLAPAAVAAPSGSFLRAPTAIASNL